MSVSLSGTGMLTVTGTSGDDVVALSTVAGALVVSDNGTSHTYSNSSISGITIDLLGGNDRATDGSTIVRVVTFLGGAGDDTLTGGYGGDVLVGGPGSDAMSPGPSNGNLGDWVDYSAVSAPLTLSLDGVANDGATGEADNILGDPFVRGGSGNDTITGSGNFNEIYGNGGDDTIDGGGGNDNLYGDAGDDRLTGGAGLAYDMIVGGDGADTFVAAGDGGPDQYFGENGIDTVDYSSRTAALTVTLVNSSSGNDGEAGENDFLLNIENAIGGSGSDTITGSAAANRLSGGAGNDALNGEGGDDVLLADTGADLLNGGTGTDLADYSARTAGVTVTLSNGTVANDGEAGEADQLIDVENATGGAGADHLYGGSGPNTIRGGAGADTLYEYEGANPGSGTGDDRFYGEAGEDILVAADGIDVLDGGSEADVVRYASTLDLTFSLDNVANDGAAGEGDNYVDVESVESGNGNDTLVGNAAANRLDGGGGNDTLLGNGGDDLLVSSAGSDSLSGGAGRDTALYSGRTLAMNLTFDGVANDGPAGETGNLGADVEDVVGGTGNDTITGSAADNDIQGNDGDDTISSQGGADHVSGGLGNDSILGGDGNDGLHGDQGSDILDGAGGNDTLLGGGDNDKLWAGPGADTMLGGDGTYDEVSFLGRTPAGVTVTFNGVADDGTSGEGDNVGSDIEVLVGSDYVDTFNAAGQTAAMVFEPRDGADAITGGSGNDVLISIAGADTFAGGGGTDRADYSPRGAAVAVSLDGVANDGQAGEGGNVASDVENLTGGAGNDTLTGSSAANVLEGGGGSDVLKGLGGNDDLRGGVGNDWMQGGAGGDVFQGGADTDEANFVDRNGVKVDLDGQANDGESGGAEGDNVMPDVETLAGSQGADTLNASAYSGGAAGVVIAGYDGNDTLVGSAGKDILLGHAGNDTITGLAGSDSAYGEGGNDVFHMRDSISDALIDGDLGTDSAQIDASDTNRSGVETLLA